MLKAAIVLVSALVGSVGIYSAASVGGVLPAERVGTQSGLSESTTHVQQAESTLWGIYGKHDVHDCPLNNREIAEDVVAASKADLGPLMSKYGVTEIRDRYHSGLEHTFLWAIETARPHDLELFAVELGIAGWNELTIVPLITFEDGVVPMASHVHGID